MKIRIGENEYEIPLQESAWTNAVYDATGTVVECADLNSALNELASLRQERDALQKRVEELEKALDIANNQERCGQ